MTDAERKCAACKTRDVFDANGQPTVGSVMQNTIAGPVRQCGPCAQGRIAESDARETQRRAAQAVYADIAAHFGPLATAVGSVRDSVAREDTADRVASLIGAILVHPEASKVIVVAQVRSNPTALVDLLLPAATPTEYRADIARATAKVMTKLGPR